MNRNDSIYTKDILISEEEKKSLGILHLMQSFPLRILIGIRLIVEFAFCFYRRVVRSEFSNIFQGLILSFLKYLLSKKKRGPPHY